MIHRILQAIVDRYSHLDTAIGALAADVAQLQAITRSNIGRIEHVEDAREQIRADLDAAEAQIGYTRHMAAMTIPEVEKLAKRMDDCEADTFSILELRARINELERIVAGLIADDTERSCSTCAGSEVYDCDDCAEHDLHRWTPTTPHESRDTRPEE